MAAALTVLTVVVAALVGAVVTAAPASAATDSFSLTSASQPGQSTITWQNSSNVVPDTVTLSGQIDSASGAISGASLSIPPLPQAPQQGENTTFTFSEVNTGTATGTYDASTGAVTLNDSFTLTFTGTGLASITCVSTPITVALSGTYNSTSKDVTLATTSSFTIPQFPANSGANCSLAASSLNAFPGGTAGSIGNAMSFALNGQFAPGLATTTALTTSVPSPQLAGTPVTLTATVTDSSGQGAPTGTVNFEANGASVGAGTLSAGTATLTTTTLPQTTNQLIALYSGDLTYAASTSNTVPYDIQPLPTITSNFPSQFTAGASSFPAPTPFTVTISNPASGAAFTNDLFLFLSIPSFTGKPNAANTQLSYEDAAGNWCPMTLAGKSGPSGTPLSTTFGPATYFSGFGTPPCGFTSAFSLNPGNSLTLNMEIAFESGTSNLAGDISLATALETGTCTSSTLCTAVAPLSGMRAVTSQAPSSIIPQTGPGTVSTTITDSGWPTTGTMRSGYAMQLAAQVKSGNSNAGAPTGTVQFFVDGQLAANWVLASSTSGTGVTGISVYDPSPLAPGTHTETINYSGDQIFAPNILTESFTVVAGPPTGTPYVCAVVASLGGAPTNYDAYVTASGTGVPTASFSGTSVTASNVSVSLDIDSAPNKGSVGAFNPQVDPAISFSPGGGTVNPGPTTFVATTPPTDLIGTWTGLSITQEVTGSPGDVVPVGVSSISFAYGFSGNVSCTPVAQGPAIGTVRIIGTTLAVSPSGSAPAGSPVTLMATVCQRPRQNPHRRPIELPTDGQRNSPGTATGIPQERTAMSALSTT